MGNIASVFLNNTTRKFDKNYHYFIPETLQNEVLPGKRVLVPFGRADRTEEAFVVDVLNDSDYKDLKSISKVIDAAPVLTPNMIKLAGWMKEMYISTFADAAKCMLPPGIGAKTSRVIILLNKSLKFTPNQDKLVDLLEKNDGIYEYDELKELSGLKGFSKYIKQLCEAGSIKVEEHYDTGIAKKTIRVASLAIDREEVISDIESSKLKKIQHIRVLEMLLDNEFISVQDVTRFAGVSASVINTLEKYGYIKIWNLEIKRDPYKHRVFERTFPLKPLEQQVAALNRVSQSIEKNIFEEILLHGVTGSGKTEVYLQLIQKCFDMNKQAIVLVPEISLTPQMVERFKGRFGEHVAVIHSRLSMGERYDQWRLIKEGSIKVVVGARSAVFAPFENVGIIIIDEEHENSYKSEVTPKYHARDIARKRCMDENCVLLLGSATPSVETYYRAAAGQIALIEMTKRTNDNPMPAVELVDMRTELDNGNRTIFSSKLHEEISANIENREQTILFMNRRGYSSFVMCRSCGFTIKCPDCNVTMTYHSHDERLICHYCGFTVKNPSVCPKCSSKHIRYFGVGTQKIEEDVKKNFINASVIRMDMDTTSFKNSHEEILNEFKEKNINILVGTQMVAKGHDFPRVTLVGVLAADSMLNINDFRASERTFQLLTQVAGRAGRSELPGRVVVQSYNIDDFSIIAASKQDYREFFNNEIIIREKLGYPPFSNIASLTLSGAVDRNVFIQAKQLAETIKNKYLDSVTNLDVIGPSRAPLSKIRNMYRWKIIIKESNLDKLIRILSDVSDDYNSHPESRYVNLNVDVNPVNML